MSSRKNKRQPYKVRPNRNAMCPCGSGRSYKNCCAEKSKASAATAAHPKQRRGSGLLIGAGIVLFFVVLFGVFRPWQNDDIADPQPWEYDAVTNQYWDPQHGHWHDGRPPAGAGQSPLTPSAPSATAQPRPWEYDAVSDRYWNPEHGHWHDGRPPAGAGAGQSPLTQPPVPSATAQPEPWEYDAENDRYWHFDHWHDGPPPAPHLR